MAVLRVGSTRMIGSRGYRVVGRLRWCETDGECWDEYALSVPGERRWISVDDEELLWRRVYPAKPFDFANMQIGHELRLGGHVYRIDTRASRSLIECEGEVDPGRLANISIEYLEAHDGELRAAIERWPAEIEYYTGVAVPKPAPDQVPPPRSLSGPRTPRQADERTVENWAVILLVAMGLAGAVLDHYWSEDECRFRRADGSEYLAACSDNQSGSVRLGSTGRRIGGFGK